MRLIRRSWSRLPPLAVFFVLAAPAAIAQSVDLVLVEKAPPPVKFGAEEVRRALEQKGLKTFTTVRPLSGTVHVFLGQRGDPQLAGIEGNRLKAPEEPESYALSVTSP